MRFLMTACLALLILSSPRLCAAGPSSLVADTRSGFILFAEEATRPRPPASLAKLMTLYLAFGALENNLVAMDTPLMISEQAAAQPKSKIYLKAGETITMREAILALIIKSANDVSTVLAENLAFSEDDFAKLMTRAGESLGLRQTVFKNASGLHHPEQLTTAQDMAVLTIALIEHYPQYYPLFSEPSFTYAGKTYSSHNIVLQEYEGAEGLKTGFVSAVGYNIISTAKKGDTRLVSVVIGGDTPLKRDLKAARLLDRGFQKIKVQEQAVADGRLAPALNPLGRKAYISRPPPQLFVPTMRLSLRQIHRRPMPTPLPREKPLQLAQLDSAPGEGDTNTWGIQVGAFEGPEKAQAAAQSALRLLGLEDKVIKTPQAKQFFRARILGFENREAAADACRQLQNRNWNCFTVSGRR